MVLICVLVKLLVATLCLQELLLARQLGSCGVRDTAGKRIASWRAPNGMLGNVTTFFFLVACFRLRSLLRLQIP